MSSKPAFYKEAEALGRLLLSKRLTLSTAESCTGGMIGAAITSVPGSSEWFRGGVIAYDNQVKMSLLNVPEAILDKHGAVSAEVVPAMAEGAAVRLNTDCAIAVSGIAGPDGGTEDKPVGLVFIGVYCKGKVEVCKNIFSGSREDVRKNATDKSLKYLIKILKKE